MIYIVTLSIRKTMNSIDTQGRRYRQKVSLPNILVLKSCFGSDFFKSTLGIVNLDANML